MIRAGEDEPQERPDTAKNNLRFEISNLKSQFSNS